MDKELPNYSRIAPDVKLAREVRIHGFVNLYGCEIGDETRIGTFKGRASQCHRGGQSSQNIGKSR